MYEQRNVIQCLSRLISKRPADKIDSLTVRPHFALAYYGGDGVLQPLGRVLVFPQQPFYHAAMIVPNMRVAP